MRATRMSAGALLTVLAALGLVLGVLALPFSAEASHRDNDRRDRYDRHDRNCSWSYNCGGYNYPRHGYYQSYYQSYYQPYYYQQPTYYYYPTTYYYYPQASSYSYAHSGGGYWWGW
jgi:hypothetical protein